MIKTIFYFDYMNMSESETLEKIYNLQTESKLADERLEMQFSTLNKRIEMLENLSKTMAENLSDMKHLQTIVDSLSNIVHQNSSDIKDLKSKYYDLEAKPTKESAKKWQTITDTIFKTVLGIILGFVLVKIGLK